MGHTSTELQKLASYKNRDPGSIFVTASRLGGGTIRVLDGEVLLALAGEPRHSGAPVAAAATCSARACWPALMAANALEELSDGSASRGLTVVSGCAGPCTMVLARLARATALAVATAVWLTDLSWSASRFTWNIAPCILDCLRPRQQQHTPAHALLSPCRIQYMQRGS